MEISNINIDYGKRHILTGASITINSGDLVALVAPNGAGKSSLLSYLSNDKAAYLPQSEYIAWDISVEDFLLLGRYSGRGVFSFYTNGDYKKVREVAETFNITHLLGRTVKTLSGGERQLCRVARTILQDRDLVLLDECEEALDMVRTKHLIEILKGLCKKGCAVIASIHALNTALMYFPKIAYIIERKIISTTQPTQDIIDRCYGKGLTLYKNSTTNCFQVY